MLRPTIVALAAAVATAQVDRSVCDACPDAHATGTVGACVCDAGYYGDGDTCTVCPDNTTTSGSTAGIADCTACADGYADHNGDTAAPACATQCDANASVSSGACVCDAGYYGDGETCTVCPNGSSTAGSTAVIGDCTACADGFHTNNGDTAAPACTTQCDANASVASGACVCDAGYYGDGETCTVCPDGSSTAGNTAAIADCTACADGFHTNNGNTAAPACVECGANEEVKQDGSGCQCAAGYSGDPCEMRCQDIAANAFGTAGAFDITVDEALCDLNIVATQADLDAIDAALSASGADFDTDTVNADGAACTGLLNDEVCTIGDTGYQLTCNTADDVYTFSAVSSASALGPMMAFVLGLSSFM